MRFLRRWLDALGGARRATAEGSILFAIGSACETVRFGPVDDEAIAHRCNAIVRKGLDKRAIGFADYREWRRRNGLVFTSVVDARGALVGFFDVFPLQASCAEALLAGRLNERSITLEHIVPEDATSRVEYLHIATIMVDPGQTAFSPTVAKEALLMRFKAFLEKHYEPLEGKVFTAYAQTRAGEALLRRAGFSAVVLPGESGQGAALYVLRPGANQEAFIRFARAERCVSLGQRRGERLSLLDRRVSEVERGLRVAIGDALEGRIDRVPANVAQKVRERIETARRKDALIDEARLAVLSEWLEFADLRELQDVILNKALWPGFEPLFQSKTITDLRFGQLAELRNCLRHSRHVGEVLEKEGEAATIWFEEMHRRRAPNDAASPGLPAKSADERA